jgi:hypothetical protein
VVTDYAQGFAEKTLEVLRVIRKTHGAVVVLCCSYDGSSRSEAVRTALVEDSVVDRHEGAEYAGVADGDGNSRSLDVVVGMGSIDGVVVADATWDGLGVVHIGRVEDIHTTAVSGRAKSSFHMFSARARFPCLQSSFVASARWCPLSPNRRI